MDYLGFSPDALKEMFFTIHFNSGTIVSVALHLFLLLLGVYALIDIVRYFAN